MSYRLCTSCPEGLSDEEKARRAEAAEVVAAALTRAKELGYLVHLAYNPNNFFMEATKTGMAMKAQEKG